MAEGHVTNPLVEQFRRGRVARNLRLMAAEGLLPLKPEDLLELWTDLIGDSDNAVRAAANRSLASFPAADLKPILKSAATPPPILWWAITHRTEAELRSVVVENTLLPEGTIKALAQVLPQALTELAFLSQTRQLRQTSLLVLRRLRECVQQAEAAPVSPEPAPSEPQSPPSVDSDAHEVGDPVRRAAVLLEEGLTDDAIQLLESVLATLTGKRRLHAQLLLAGGYSKHRNWTRRTEELLFELCREHPRSAEPCALLASVYAKHGFNARAMSMSNKARALAPKSDFFLPESQTLFRYLTEEEMHQTEKLSTLLRLYRLNTAEKVVTALDGTPEERALLVRDPNRLVAAAVLGSPCITVSEIEAIASMAGVAEEVLEYIGDGAHPRWSKVVVNLLSNPRTPRATSSRLLARLDPSAIERVASDESLPQAVVSVARALIRDGSLHDKDETRKSREAVVRRVEALVATATQPARAIVGCPTSDERERIREAIDAAAKALKEQSRTEREDENELEGLFALTPDEQEELLMGLVRFERPRGARRATRWARDVTRDRWSAEASDFYRALLSVRLRAQRCVRCGASLASASLVQTSAQFDDLINDLQLSDERAALLHAATDDLEVNCSDCGTPHITTHGRTEPASQGGAT